MSTTRRDRRCGVLLHPTSLPGPHGIGDLGAGARRFVDWLAEAGQSLWQVLPLGPVGPGNSPYMSDSAFAGNPLLIDLGQLADEGWLPESALAAAPEFDPQFADYHQAREFKATALSDAARGFFADASQDARRQFAAFREKQASWCEDYALFSVLSKQLGGPWSLWPELLRDRNAAALEAVRARNKAAIDEALFEQWCFDRQWTDLKRYANDRGIAIVGDMPIYVAHHSAEVWANPQLFDLDGEGNPIHVAGVPPDYFSETGQRWGNPLYRWRTHAADGYRWWSRRLAHAFDNFDRLRIDHFRGFEAFWEIPAACETAVDGQWRPGPADELFKAVSAADRPVIAEDLGIITAEVTALRERLGFPGMRILQFAFDGRTDNPYLPHNYQPDSVVYTGTHDNDTTLGWWSTIDQQMRDRVREYLASDGRSIHWDLIRTAFASVADLVIVPMQDILGLGGDSRMNKPGDAEGWWTWRLDEGLIQPWHATVLASLAQRYGRSAEDEEA